MDLRRIGVATLVAGLMAAAMVPASAGGAEPEPPRTEFEESGGAEWTSHEGELSFLPAVDKASNRVEIDTIGTTKRGRPVHLVRMGHPAPAPRALALRRPPTLFVCSQHGNEPAGREACLQRLRDLAFTDDPQLVAQLKAQTILFVPSANPDGRESNSRGNSDGTDINRDHLHLATPEARAIAAVVRDWEPEAVVDLHEYGPAIPAVYDDEVLVLWPRNLNVDEDVHAQAKDLALEYIAKDEEEAGYSTDEYGMYEVAGHDIHQAAGDGDEGIARNAMGLRHSLGILVESRVNSDVRNGPQELNDPAVRLRRVASQNVAIDATLRFMRERGEKVARVTATARRRAIEEGRLRREPVYFGGADNSEPSEDEIQDPPPCGYELTKEQLGQVKQTMRLLDIVTRGTYVSMAQEAEPLIALVLDERGERHSVAAAPDMEC
ncbi:MAG TPA: M14 family metallocarboxypeptidase [Actinomycetota bacterium]|nr:M14 family metallocarboxypeptidase [Actinomycetota bacterium]